MPIIEVRVDQFKLSFVSAEDWINFVNANVVPTGQQYGFRVVVEKLAKDEPHVGRV